MPTRIFEYLAMNKPVVAPRTRGIQDYFQEGELLFFEPGNVEDLARKMEWVYQHPAEARCVMERGRRVYQQHTWDLERGRFTALVKGLLAKGEEPKPPREAPAVARKKIWIDLDNTPHVPLFAPIVQEIRRRGYEVVLTARDAFQVCELAERKQMDCLRIGRHSGKNKLRKLAGLFYRAAQLAPVVLREKPVIGLASTRSGLTVRRSTFPFMKASLWSCEVRSLEAAVAAVVAAWAAPRRKRRRGDLTDIGRGEEMAGERGLLLLGDALLFRIGGDRRRGRVRLEDRPAEIAGQGRSELGNVALQPGIVVRQIGEAIRRHAVVGVVELRADCPQMRLQSEEQRAADADGRDGAKTDEHAARKPRDGRPAGSQPHFLRRPVASQGPAASSCGRVCHDCGLPSVRTMRTFFWCSPPSRSSAAANNRSTIMWLSCTR